GTQPRDRLAQRIANTIQCWFESGERLDSLNRKICPGDILVLVRSRDAFVGKLIKALKARGIAVAGADRMKLGEQLAVMDLMAVGDFVLLPGDDLTLACVLKSPLIGFDDDDLFDLAYKRPGALWNALRGKAKTDLHYAAAAAQLGDWLNRADTAPPYEFFARLLEENQMRMRLALIARLGPDAGDAIDEFLNLAIDYERVSHPSLQGFLDWMRKGDAEVKRDMEQGRDEVRIMTVHGAKGLEANVVFLPDTCRTPSGVGNKPKLLPLPRASAPPGTPEHLVWVPPGVMELKEIRDAKIELKEKEREEYNRLLYVAMTRARDRLYVCGWKGANKVPENCWYKLVSAGLEGVAQPAKDALGEDVLRTETKQSVKAKQADSEPQTIPLHLPLPEWAKADAPTEVPANLPLTPSAISPQGEEEKGQLREQDVTPPLERAGKSRFLRGKLVHDLLQHLPDIAPDKREAAARGFVSARGEALGEAGREEIIAETLAILECEQFAPLFGPESQAEVPITARIPRPGKPGLEFSGQIDRIVILGDEVLLVDYKTNRPPPERPQDVAPLYLRQLAAYRYALGQIYPEKKVRAALLWTEGARIMVLPDALLDAAMARIVTL
ncbi:MAG: PD-(D/E)XK nuclease family protein, partial [Proteobacteria bacterium]|nr:PD-(D/E)XK nuclease family protein [Pseudomonadota bacterium]